MNEHWERSRVTGTGAEGLTAAETVIHRRGEDALQMAVRRNPELAACSRIEVMTVSAFVMERAYEMECRKRGSIPRAGGPDLEWDW